MGCVLCFSSWCLESIPRGEEGKWIVRNDQHSPGGHRSGSIAMFWQPQSSRQEATKEILAKTTLQKVYHVHLAFYRSMHGMYTNTTQCQRKMCKKSKPAFRERTENFSMPAKYAGNFHWAMSKVLRRAPPWQRNKNSPRLDIIFVSAKTT